MKSKIISWLIGGVALAGAPIIPSEMEILYSYEADCTVLYEQISSSTAPRVVGIENPVCDGGKYAGSVFVDKSGNEVHVQIPRAQYSEMGAKDGFTKNPTRDEYISIFTALTPKADAALAVISNSSVSNGTGVTSITWSHTVASGSNRLLVVQVALGGGVTVSSVTYNSVAASQVGTVIQGGYDRVDIWKLTDPDVTTANIVVTASAASDGFKGWGTNFTDASGTVDGFASIGDSTASEVGVDVTTVNGNYIVGVFMGQPLNLKNLPDQISGGEFEGYVEGWSWSTRFNELFITLNLSPVAFSQVAMRWNTVPINETFQTIDQTLTWEYATIVA